MLLPLFLGELAPAYRAYHGRSGLFEPSPRIETSNITDYFGHFLSGSSLALDPGVRHDAVGVEAGRWLNHEQAPD